MSKRTRFEILKRDGFRCRYCGTTALSTVLEVDHVVPRADGGTDDPENLVTACFECNRGKSDISLDESRLPDALSCEDLREQAKQIKGYLAAQKLVTDAKQEVAEHLAGVWREHCDEEPLLSLFNRFVGLAEQYPLEWLTKAIVAAGGDQIRGYDHALSVNRVRYFYGCLRKMRERSEGTA